MTDSANEMTPQEKIIQERVAQTRKFLTSNGFNQSKTFGTRSKKIQNMIYCKNIK